ncbi:hypothetical protein J9303_12840 [Bacillaceae bacterium Marseille-Q3522]|nr:hypothetical protein [Bacillaceae bacterium Marseille-Q3522]
MGEIQIKAGELEALSEELKKSEYACENALDILERAKMLKVYDGFPDHFLDLHAEFEHSIKLSSDKLAECREFVTKTSEEMQKKDREMAWKLGLLTVKLYAEVELKKYMEENKLALEFFGVFDVIKLISGKDPLTGEPVSEEERIFIGVMTGISLFPLGRLVGFIGRPVLRGLGMAGKYLGLDNWVKDVGDFLTKKNVINPERIKKTFTDIYENVIKAPISATKFCFDEGMKKLGDLSVPTFYLFQFAGVAKHNRKIKDIIEDVKDDLWLKYNRVEGKGEELLAPDGLFKDFLLEARYQKYLERKAKEGKAAKGRLEWKVASDYFLYDSPLARGNRFNETVQELDLYEYHEIHLANGKRLDSYDPDAGEIISRKATDLDLIDEKTYRVYLREMKVKYAAGTKIRSNVFSELDGTRLKGDLILEVPASNKDIPDIEKYIEIAKEYDIKLRFTEE